MKEKIIKKPWGHECLLEINKKFMFKRLFMKKNHRCSLQYHNQKIESVYVLKGKLRVVIKKNKKIRNIILKANDNILIKKKTIHRMEAISNCTYLEASTPDIKDVVRLEDDYSRVK
jgi:mannose-6-phosphate isomerase-like protein (cupin superfamily)